MIFRWADLSAVVRRRPVSSPLPTEAVEFSVDRAQGPFLVTGASGLIWLDGGRSSIRTLGHPFKTVSALESEIVERVRVRSMESKWESLFPYTKEGVTQAHQRLMKYGYTQVRSLVGPGADTSLLNSYQLMDALPPGSALMTSADPGEAGWVGVAGDLAFVVIHDPSRVFSFLAP